MPVSKPRKARLPLVGEDPNGSKSRVDRGPANPNLDLLNKVEAINRALQSWNDQEVLRLMRLHWRQIARSVGSRA